LEDAEARIRSLAASSEAARQQLAALREESQARWRTAEAEWKGARILDIFLSLSSSDGQALLRCTISKVDFGARDLDVPQEVSATKVLPMNCFLSLLLKRLELCAPNW
jgi:hypothetical protein